MSVKTDIPNVATAVSTVQVRQGEEGAFAGWLTELNKTIATFPGYVSAVVIPPVPLAQSDWIIPAVSDYRKQHQFPQRRSRVERVGPLR